MSIKRRKLLMATVGTAGLATFSAVVPALSSCGLQASNIKLGAEYDKEYGVDEAVYTALKTAFWNKYKEKYLMFSKKEEILNAQRSFFNTMSRIEEQSNNLSYTAMSNTIIEYASRLYGIKLCRNKTANWNDVYKMFDGMSESFAIYMKHCDLSEQQIAAIQNDAKKMFYDFIEDKETGLKAKYDDPLTALIQAKSFLSVCFADINSEVGLTAAANRLSQFLQDYQISFNASVGDSNRLDTIENKLTAVDPETKETVTFEVGADITPFMTKVFNIVRASDGHVLEADEYNRHLLPGYTIKPILKNISKDPYANQYTLDIDWQCVKSNYVEKYPERVEATTAHFYNGDNIRCVALRSVDKENIGLSDLINKDSIATISYPILLTPAGEKQAIYDAYFNPNFKSSEENDFSASYLDFKWDTDKQKNAYDAFFRGTLIKDDKTSNDSSKEEHLISTADLAQSGLSVAVIKKGSTNEEVEYRRLDEFIATGAYQAEKRVENSEDTDDLLAKFLNNCELQSHAVMTNLESDKHEATNTLYALYKNTSDVSATRKELKTVETNGFIISDSTYYFLTSRYNDLAKYANTYASNAFADEHEELKVEIGLTLGLFGLNALLNGLCLWGIYKFPPKASYYWGIMVTASLSQLCQVASLLIFIFAKWKVSEDYAKNCSKFQKTQECQDLVDKLDEDAKQFDLLKSNAVNSIKKSEYNAKYETFKLKSWPEVKKAIDFYQNVGDDPLFLKFRAKASECGVDPQEYSDKMEGWKPGHCYFNATMILDGASLLLDIANLVLMIKAPDAMPAGAAIKAANEASNAKKEQDLADTRIIEQQTSTEDLIEVAPLVQSKFLYPASQSRISKSIPEAELQEIKEVKMLKNPVNPKADPRLVVSNEMFHRFHKLQEPKYYLTKEMGDMDYVGEAGYNQWKYFRNAYGDKGTGNNAFKNFVKEFSKINKYGEAEYPLGPECITRVFGKEEIRVIRPGDVTGSMSFKEAVTNNLLDYSGLSDLKDLTEIGIKAEWIEKFEKATKTSELCDCLDQLCDEILPKLDGVWKLTPANILNDEKAIGSSADAFYTALTARMFNKSCEAWNFEWVNYLKDLKITEEEILPPLGE